VIIIAGLNLIVFFFWGGGGGGSWRRPLYRFVEGQQYQFLDCCADFSVILTVIMCTLLKVTQGHIQLCHKSLTFSDCISI